MKLKKISSYAIGMASFVALHAYATSPSTPVNMNNQWYQGVQLNNTIAKNLDLKVGDSVVIDTPLDTYVGSSWGALTFSNCKPVAKTDKTANICTLSSVGGPWAQGITTVGLNATNQTGTTSRGAVEVITSPQPQSKASITIKLPKQPNYIQTGHLADIIIYQGDTPVREINNQAWNTAQSYEVLFQGDRADFSISVPSLDKAKGNAAPANLNLSNDSNQEVNISYSEPQQRRQVNINLSYVGNAPSTEQPSYRLVELNGNNQKVVKTGKLNKDINHLGQFAADTKGVNYRFYLGAFIDGETQYTPDKYEQEFMLDTTTGQKTINVVYNSKVLPETSLQLSVGHLPSGKTSQLTLSDGDSKDILTTTIDHNGAYNINVPQNLKTWHVAASSVNKYIAKVTPSAFISDGKQKQVTLKFKEQINTPLSVGYLTSWNKRVTISEAAEHGYNTIVLAFAKVDKDKVGMSSPWYVYAKDWSKPEGGWKFFMKQDIEKAKASGKLKYVILSVGGENNTFAPGKTDPNIVAKNIVDYAKGLDADGIDFDIENYGSGFGAGVTPEQAQEHLYQTIKAIKTLAPNFIITAAPQLNLIDSTHVNLVNTATQQIYNKAIKAGLFNYLFVQEYNTGNYCINDQGVGSLCSGYTKENVNQANPKFINNSYVRLKQIVPQNTLIVPGQPSDATAAGQATVYHGAYQGNPYPELCKAYHKLANSNDPQYGGAMVWSINQDAANGYKFANSVFTDTCATS